MESCSRHRLTVALIPYVDLECGREQSVYRKSEDEKTIFNVWDGRSESIRCGDFELYG